MPLLTTAALVATLGLSALPEVKSVDLNLASSSIVVEAPASPRSHVYAAMLSDEVFRRVGMRWPVANDSGSGGVAITLATNCSCEVDRSSSIAEGYTLTVDGHGVRITGADQRGLLYGVGRLIRLMNLTLTENYFHARRTTLTVPVPISIHSHPDRPMRGIQFGYRPKTNSYDGLTPDIFEQYIVDLAMFGLNQAELIPHSFDDSPYSPHFGLPHFEMNVAMSKICDKYGINVSLWYPACNPGVGDSNGCPKGNFHDPTIMSAATKDYHKILSSMPRVDTLFVNAGDPGGQSPDDLVMVTKIARKILLEYHPHADTWVCPQDWKAADFQRWNALIAEPNTTQWLTGVIYGPGMLVDVPTFIKMTPGHFPLRLYPDITHSVSDQLPVPDWDPAYQFTLNREPVNPRPTQQAAIAWRQKVHADAGIGTYNEGCHDDVNKHVWLAMFWGCDVGDERDCLSSDPDGWKKLLDLTLRDYANVHFGALLAPLVHTGIYALEQNWVGAVANNSVVPTTSRHFQAIHAAMTPRHRWIWRLQQLFYRANYDMFVYTRVQIEQDGERTALAHLRSTSGSVSSRMAAAERTINASLVRSKVETAELWTEMRVWAEAVFQSVHQQFSVPIYGGEYTRRGANLDLAKLPLATSNLPFIYERLQQAKRSPPTFQFAIVQELISHTAAPGGYYDDLGEISNQPHLVLKADPTSQGDCRGLANYTIVTESPTSQYYDLPDPLSLDQNPYDTSKSSMSRSPPELPANITRQELTHIEVKHGIKLRMRYQIAKPGAYEVVLVGQGTNVEIGVNGEPPIKVESLVPSTGGRRKTVVLPGILSKGIAELTLSTSASNSEVLLPSELESGAGSLSVSEMWLTPH